MIDGKWIFHQLELENKHVMKIYDQWLDHVAAGLISLVHVFNPELILIGGGVSSQDKLLIEPIHKKVKTSVMPRYANNLEIEPASLANDAGMVGAVYYYLYEY